MLMYGEGAQGLADSRGLTMDEANETINKVLKAMPNIDKTSQIVNQFAEQCGFVSTISGHVRRLPDATQSKDLSKKSRAIRQAFNSVVQGSGAYCTNTALIILRNLIRKYQLKSRIVITVHDSIVLDVHPSEIKIVPLLAKQVMEHLPIPNFILKDSDFPDLKIADKYRVDKEHFRFPLIAEMAFGKTYGDDLDFSYNEYHQLGNIETYYDYAKKCKLVSDTYNTKLKNTNDDDEKAKIVKDRDQKLSEIHQQYFKE